MKLELNLRRIRSSVRTDINTGSRNTQSASKAYNSSAACASKICVRATAQLCGRDSLDVENV